MHLKREDGAAAVEFAIVLPLLMVILFGIIEFGFALYNKEVITNASREAARAGIVQAPKLKEGDIEGVAKAYLRNAGWDDAKVDKADITVTGAEGSFPSSLTVKVDYLYSFSVLPNFITGFGKDITLSAATVMTHE